MKAKVNKVNIEIVQCDIFSLNAAGLVHSTDSNFSLHPKLLAGAGPTIQAECVSVGWCDVGSAVVTNAGRLQAKKVIHAVGPRWGEGSERGKLANVTWAVLNLAEENELDTVVMPPISTGALGYPLENCAITMLSQIVDFTFEKLKHLKTILICVDNEVALEVFEREFRRQIDELNETGTAKVRV